MPTTHQLCSELLPLYNNWHQALSEARLAQEEFFRAPDKPALQAAREHFTASQRRVEESKRMYQEQAKEIVEWEGKQITQKNLLVILQLKEKVGEIERWQTKNDGSVEFIRFPQNTVIPLSETIYFPTGLQRLNLAGAAISQPENLNLPTGLQWLDLAGATITEDFREKLREYKKQNPQVYIGGVNF